MRNPKLNSKKLKSKLDHLSNLELTANHQRALTGGANPWLDDQ
mgnify:CR=1 FL=1